jgi:cytochrome c oxidase subunit 2
MAIFAPEKRIWWKEPVHGLELGWIIITFLWGLFMFFFMIAWHFIGNQNLSTETYKIQPDRFVELTEAFAEEFQAMDANGEPMEEEGVPVVRPVAGGDVYLLARLWEFWPIIELKKGESYRFHISSADWQHGMSLQPVNLNLSVHPGYEHVLSLTPTEAGIYGIVCNEFCGIGHHNMTGRIRVVE